MTEIIIEMAAVPGVVLVVVPGGGWIKPDYVSAHRSHADALDEALRLQKGTFAPAIIRDLVAGGDEVSS